MAVPGLTLAQLEQRVAINTQDINAAGDTPNFVAWPKVWIDNWLNDCITRVCADTTAMRRWIQFGLAANPRLPGNATAEYEPVDTEPGSLDQLSFVQAGSYKCWPADAEELFTSYLDWETRIGTPYRFMYGDWAPGILKLVLDPGTVLATVRGIGTLKPTLMSAAGDLPPFDSEYHQLCEFYATAKALGRPGEQQDRVAAADWMGQYDVLLAGFKEKLARKGQTGGTVIPYRHL